MMSDDKKAIIKQKKLFDEKKLIELVKENPELYNNAKNPQVQDEIWEEIAKKMNHDVESCKKKWDIICCQFRKYYKMKRKQWKHYELMEFLAPYLNKFPQTELDFPNSDSLDVKFEFTDENNDEQIDSVAGCSTVEETNLFNSDLNNSNEEFFNSIALILNTFPEEHQLRIKAIVLQQIHEVQTIMDSKNLQFPVNPFTKQQI